MSTAGVFFRRQPAFGGSLLALGFASILHAMGSPPLITDDPGTPGDGHWEINVGIGTEQRPGARSSEMPLIDLNYGIGDRIQLRYEVPYLSGHEDGSPDQSGLGNSGFGVKWRFYDPEEEGLAVSVYPQLEFNTPGSSADKRGLVDHGAAFTLPLQFERAAGPVTFVWQAGREFRAGGDTWLYGVSASHRLSERVEVGLELAGSADAGLHRSVLATNLGIAVGLGEHSSLQFALGRELHNREEPRATLIGYLGLQWRR